HWFATEEALGEIARVMSPGGYLALIWNRRDLAQPLQAELTRIMAPYRKDTPTHEDGSWRAAMSASHLFEFVSEDHLGFEQVLTAQGLADRVVSTSFMANLPPSELDRVGAEVRALVPEGDSFVVARYDCEAYLYRRA
ncbi:MAG TPA: hypothetical protein VGP46_02730, partial [Acidimicrobiales bacterium]|nr:hypothetical protein [Acidimicrobiales bacterium]